MGTGRGIPRRRGMPDGERGGPGSVGRIRGSTTVTELLERFPDGSAMRLLARLQVPCAYCGGALHEPLTLAARRHRRNAGAFLRACQALETGGASDQQIAEALVKEPPRGGDRP